MSIFTRSIVSDMLDFTKKGIAKDFFNQFEKAVPVPMETVSSFSSSGSGSDYTISDWFGGK